MNCKEILEQYIKWIRDNTSIQAIDDGKVCEITTPFLDRHNDSIQIYVEKKGDKYLLKDDSYTIEDLRMSGMELNTPKRQKVFNTIINGFGIKSKDNGELYVEADYSNIGQKKHYLLQAIIAVNDMYTLSQESIYSFFKEDVERYFQTNDIYYSKDIKLTGKTGFDHNIDFIIAASKNKPERLVKTINVPTKDPIMSAIFAFTDIKSQREQTTKNYVIYNDTEKKVAPDVVAALDNYGIQDIPWSEKDRCREELVLV